VYIAGHFFIYCPRKRVERKGKKDQKGERTGKQNRLRFEEKERGRRSSERKKRV